uniref:Microsomal glutathione S-transferase 1 n=1 Tax=Globisporangium ultimum (strain ATCC 200006 / CBS 805.95 / DAOM BR144) TaxID=431595 RepID=K3WC91_GLOUD
MAESSFQNATDVQVLVVCVFVVYVKFLATTMIQGRRSFDAGTRVPEDSSLPQAKGKPDQSFDFCLDHPDDVIRAAIHDELRWKRIVQNDVEAIPLALIVFLISISVGARENVNIVAVLVFTIMRIVHTISYANKMPLLRMISWIVGVLCILTSGVNGVSVVIN